MEGLSDCLNDEEGIWKKTISINLVGVIEGSILAIRNARKTKKPLTIVNVASAAGLWGMPFEPIYGATKHGVVGFTRSLVNLAPEGIKCTVIAPWNVQTPMFQVCLVWLIQS